MSSSYTNGTRIAMDITDESKLNLEYITDLIQKIKSECGADVSLSTHSILADSESWESVLKSDKFFEDVKVINDIGTFIGEIKKDRTLKGIDIARYILSKIPCTHLKLEKLVYLCFADYLCEKKKKLFDDTIYAFKYGPVVLSVYKTYKKYGGEPIVGLGDYPTIEEVEKEIKEVDEDSGEIVDSEEFGKQTELESPQRSRILFAEEGISKLTCIDSTIEKYKAFTASQLVKITHKKDTPWDKTDKNEFYSEISDETILKYHCNEGLKE